MDVFDGIGLPAFGELGFVLFAPTREEELAIFLEAGLFLFAFAKGGFGFVEYVGINGNFGGEAFGHGFELVISLFAVAGAVGFIKVADFVEAFSGNHETITDYGAGVKIEAGEVLF